MIKEGLSTLADADSCKDSWGDFLGDSCDLSQCVPEVSSGVPVLTDVLDSSSSLVFCCRTLIGETLEPQSSSFSRKRQALCVEKQEDMNYDGTPVKAPPASRRKIMPPTPRQSLQPSIEAWRWRTRKRQLRDGVRRRTSVVGTRWNGDRENGAVPERE